MNVLSLFDGISAGQLALQRAGLKVDEYYASEIDKYAIQVTQKNFPNTIQVGDICNLDGIKFKDIDIVFGGSPCQDLSAAGKRAGINGSKSSLFFVFVEILEHIKSLNPKVLFLQENVGSASKLDVGIMSRALGVYPVRINSSLVTAQLRDRYYWSNIRTKETMFDLVTDIPQPQDRKIMFKDILESGNTKYSKSDCLIENAYKDLYKDMDKFKLFILKKESEGFGRKNYVIEKDNNLLYQENNKLKIKTNTTKGFDIVTENDCIDLSFPSSTTRRGRVTKGKSPCLMESVNNIFALQNYRVRNLTKTEFCRLQGFPDNYCDILSIQKSISLLGDGWTLPIIEHIFSFIKNN